MKIERGKLYYNGVRLYKASVECEDNSGFITDKIAVHCPTKEDWDYVIREYNVYGIDDCWYEYKLNSYIAINSDAFGNIEDNIPNNQIITIEQFKQFYKMKEQTEPQYFAISKEEWQEYQELKGKVDKPIEILGCIMNNLDDFNTEQEFKPERYDNYQLITSDYRFDVFKANLQGCTDDILFFGHWNSGKVK